VSADLVRLVSLDDASVRGIADVSQSLGRPCFVIDLQGCGEKACLLERTAAALGFPDWFGHNWDGWFDCLADLSWQPVARGYVLVLRHAEGLRAAAPEAFDTALTILADASKVWAGREVEFRVFIDASPDIGLSL
jgi:RNAse (barnase) inhibitor barstar